MPFKSHVTVFHKSVHFSMKYNGVLLVGIEYDTHFIDVVMTVNST